MRLSGKAAAGCPLTKTDRADPAPIPGADAALIRRIAFRLSRLKKSRASVTDKGCVKR